MITVAGNTDRETVVHKVARDICFVSCIDGLNSVDSEVLKFRGPEKSTLKDSLICKTDDTSDDQMDETRITYTKAGEQEPDVIIESAAPVDHEKSTLTDPISSNTDDTSDDHMDVTRSTYTKVDEQERDVQLQDRHHFRGAEVRNPFH